MMRAILAALAVAGVLAVTEAPATASTLGPPIGNYHGSSHHGSIAFHLNHDYEHVTNFRIHGHTYFTSVGFHLGSHTHGYFSVFLTSRNMHIWGNWSGTNYGHVAGGYSYMHDGERVTQHWTAVAEGF